MRQELIDRIFNVDTIYLMFFAVLGVVIYYLLASLKRIKSNKPINWKVTIINLTLSLVISFGLVAGRESIDSINMNEGWAMIIGSSAIGIFDQIRKAKLRIIGNVK